MDGLKALANALVIDTETVRRSSVISERDREITCTRLEEVPPSYRKLGEAYGVTPERIRQIAFTTIRRIQEERLQARRDAFRAVMTMER
jgi:DNA-directed RNA polymerase sigma subunit (sigma70/sigma32)